ncbi:EboA domain-containing protein [Streptomyces sp. NPDC006259]|uniref:EboA domain-containing protein n=1 Tax=Streptomyces sp. NPDC006259 TaxID=3364740 RepID=UPI003674813C
MIDRHTTAAVPARSRRGTTPAPGATSSAPAPEEARPTWGTPDALRHRLESELPEPARAWFLKALDEAAAHPGTHGPVSTWELRLAEAGRRCGRRHADAVRMLILRAARADPAALCRVYFQGTADERRAVLRALPYLVSGPDALPLVEDALRTNDTRLLAAAVGPYAARHLDAHGWRHAVLKCLFTGVPVDAVADLAGRARADAELARMLADHAAERTAAGRPVPSDLHRVLALTDSAGPAGAVPPPHGTRPHGTHPPGAPSHGAGHPHGKES